MEVNIEKVKNMLLFFVNKMGKITSIKLQKAMLFADRIHWALYKQSISGLEYVKAQYGPVMEDAGKEILDAMDRSVFTVTLSKTEESVENKYLMKVRTTDKVPDMTVFSEKEELLLERAYKIISEHTDEEIVEMTHDMAWENAKVGEVLSYDSCIHDEIIDSVVDLSADDKQVVIDAIKREDYSALEALADTWI